MSVTEVSRCQDPAKRIPYRIFAFLGLLHWVSGLVFVVIGLIIYWTYAILPAVWFAVGFLWVNAAHWMVTDYRYDYRDGSLSIYKIKFGAKKLLVDLPMKECTFEKADGVVKVCNDTPNMWVNYQNKCYALEVSPYLSAVCKGEIDVS